MADRPRSEDQLNRILQLLPLATREDGVHPADLARALGVSESELVRDLGEVIGRSYYRPAGSPDDVTVLIEPDRVEVWTAHEFRRPPRLTRREAIALGLALRTLGARQAGERGPDRAEPIGRSYAELATKLENRLLAPTATPVSPSPIEISAGVIGPSGTHETLVAAARDRRRCRIAYLRSGAQGPETRDIDPYVVLIASGRWYVAGYCHARAGVRVFRVDRVLEAERLADGFEVPSEFDPSDYVDEGRVYRAEEFQEVVIRYSARVARWIAEQGPTEPLTDGSVQVRYSVADPRWAVRHVLEHAPEAEVVEPDSVRALVRAISLGLAAG